MISRQRSRPSIPEAETLSDVVALARFSPRRCCARASPSASFIFAARRFGLFRTSRSHCSKPSPTRRSSPSRTCGLFKELGERNAELREALEHQTATAEVLGIISRSPTDVQPVLDAIVESAARVCGIDDVVLRLHEGNTYGFAGSFWSHTHRPRRDQY